MRVRYSDLSNGNSGMGASPSATFAVGPKLPRSFANPLPHGVNTLPRIQVVATRAYREIKHARPTGFDEWATRLAWTIADGAAKVWIAMDPDVLNLGSNPDFGDEPLGPTTEELTELTTRSAERAAAASSAVLGLWRSRTTLRRSMRSASIFSSTRWPALSPAAHERGTLRGNRYPALCLLSRSQPQRRRLSLRPAPPATAAGRRAQRERFQPERGRPL